MSKTIVLAGFSKEKTTAKNRFMSLKVNLKAWGAAPIETRFPVPNSTLAVTLRERISTSRFGELYTAVVHNSTVEPAADAQTTHLVKVYFPIKGNKTDKGMLESTSLMFDRAKREYALTRFINYQSLNDPAKVGLLDPCYDAALCGDIFLQQKNQVAVAFPFTNAIDLRTFLVGHFYPSYSAGTRVEYQREALAIGRLLMKSIERLNAFGVYHGNIDPLNILVSFEHKEGQIPHVTVIRMMDFDFACMELEPAYEAMLVQAGLIDVKLKDLTCKMLTSPYSTEARFRDPDANNKIPELDRTDLTVQEKKRIVDVRWQKYERYAAAMVIQLLFDPDQVLLVDVKIRETLRAPAALTELLQSMIGPINARPDYGTITVRLDAIRQLAR